MTFVARNIDEVIAQLTMIVSSAEARGDRLGYFAALYRQVTLEVKRGIVAGRFDDAERMDRFDTAFGNRYFAALGAWESGQEPPRCWRVAFELLTSDETIILQHLLLGVNAHINFDLAFAAALAAPCAAIDSLARDYDIINDILSDVLNQVQAALGTVSPFMHLLDELGGRTDEWALDFSIRTARAQAWQHARALAHADDAQKALMATTLDLTASTLARLIVRPAGILRPALEIIRYGESRPIATVIEHLDHAYLFAVPPS